MVRPAARPVPDQPATLEAAMLARLLAAQAGLDKMQRELNVVAAEMLFAAMAADVE